MKRQCRHCMRWRDEADVGDAMRKGGGGYRRPHRWYHSSLCIDCAVELMPHITEGHRVVSLWSVRDVRHVAARRPA